MDGELRIIFGGRVHAFRELLVALAPRVQEGKCFCHVGRHEFGRL